MIAKPVERLTVDDLIDHPVWEFSSPEVTEVRPVRELPVHSMCFRMAGTKVRLANGSKVWAMLSNISLRDIRATRHFLTVSIDRNGTWFHLARYFDVAHARFGPRQLAKFLELPVSSVFPIEYDLSDLIAADRVFVTGSVLAEPEERLSLEEVIQLSLSAREE